MNRRGVFRSRTLRRCLPVAVSCAVLFAASSIAVEAASGSTVVNRKVPATGVSHVSGGAAWESPVPDSAAEGLDSTRLIQDRLATLGYLSPAAVDGREGPDTATAIVAFQKWQGLPRTGTIDTRTRSALARAARPTPIADGANGRQLEVLVDRQLLLAVQGDRVVRTIDVSTGKPSTPTPVGSFDVYAKYPRWWSTPFSEWLLWAAPFSGGIAIHEFASVPSYAASHGCVRVTKYDARWVYRFVSVDTPVRVLASSR
ncbi:MAG TPA: L,D-transpeptidase family protein [Gaiellaceae bacterium]|jgi:lipoprotein-anchoring transpeptidase ErfK/SrfK|nr:L,D-transpeptidase family protein [Gaiellaceae bacterium]